MRKNWQHISGMQTEYSVVIATRNRTGFLKTTLESLAGQALRPQLVVLADASDDPAETRAAMESVPGLAYSHQCLVNRSAARQRNAGAALVSTGLISFMDDDVKLEPDVMWRLAECFAGAENRDVRGVAARIKGMEHRTPGFFLWLYYRIQAGYSHADYGGRLFGPGLNCLPCYHNEDPEKIPADWLNSTCVMYRTELFNRVKFPDWDGYSFMEDVWLSAKIGKGGGLYFLKSACYEHFSAPGEHKADACSLARMRICNQKRIAREIQGIRPVMLKWKMLMHRMFVSVILLYRRGQNWKEEWRGLWTFGV